jgi:hypothetical protein
VQNSQLQTGDTQANVNIRVYNNTCIGIARMVGASAQGFQFTGHTWRNNIIAGQFTANNNNGFTTATISNNLLQTNTIPGNTNGSATFVIASNNDYRLVPSSLGIDMGATLPPYTNGFQGTQQMPARSKVGCPVGVRVQ